MDEVPGHKGRRMQLLGDVKCERKEEVKENLQAQ